MDRLTAESIPGFNFGQMLGLPATGVLNVGQQFGFNPQTMQMALGAVGLPLGILSGLNTLGASVANSARFGAARDKALSQSGYTTPAQQSEVVSGYMSGAPVSLYGMDAYKSLADLQTKDRKSVV